MPGCLSWLMESFEAQGIFLRCPLSFRELSLANEHTSGQEWRLTKGGKPQDTQFQEKPWKLKTWILWVWCLENPWLRLHVCMWLPFCPAVFSEYPGKLFRGLDFAVSKRGFGSSQSLLFFHLVLEFSIFILFYIFHFFNSFSSLFVYFSSPLLELLRK